MLGGVEVTGFFAQSTQTYSIHGRCEYTSATEILFLWRRSNRETCHRNFQFLLNIFPKEQKTVAVVANGAMRKTKRSIPFVSVLRMLYSSTAWSRRYSIWYIYLAALSSDKRFDILGCGEQIISFWTITIVVLIRIFINRETTRELVVLPPISTVAEANNWTYLALLSTRTIDYYDGGGICPSSAERILTETTTTANTDDDRTLCLCHRCHHCSVANMGFECVIE